MRTYEQARRMKAPRAIALCQCFSGALDFQAGNWREAEAALRESIQLYRQIGAASGEALACQRLGMLQTARGQLEAGLATLEEGIIAAERASLRAHCLARLYAAMVHNRLEVGDVVAADSALTIGLEMSRRHGHCASCDTLLMPAAVRVRVRQGDLTAAEDFCHQLEQAAAKYASRIWMAMARQARAELAAAQSEVHQAIALYCQAHRDFTATGNAYEAARCLAALAHPYQTRHTPGDPEAASAARREAQQILDRLRAG